MCHELIFLLFPSWVGIYLLTALLWLDLRVYFYTPHQPSRGLNSWFALWVSIGTFPFNPFVLGREYPKPSGRCSGWSTQSPSHTSACHTVSLCVTPLASEGTWPKEDIQTVCPGFLRAPLSCLRNSQRAEEENEQHIPSHPSPQLCMSTPFYAAVLCLVRWQ